MARTATRDALSRKITTAPTTSVPVRGLRHLRHAGGTSSRRVQLVVALLADDVRVVALVDPAFPHRHAHRAFQLATPSVAAPLHLRL